MDEADRVADRVAIIDHGELLVLDTPESLKRSVGEGDVVEIRLEGPISDADGERVQAAFRQAQGEHLASSVSQALLDAEHSLLTVRALNAVGSLPAVLVALEEIGLKAGEVRVRENTLEDVFIQLTGRRLRE
jgi:ABC-2 type transport system ATP-binding protein